VKVAQLPSGLDPADLILSAGGGSSSGGKEAWNKVIRDSTDIITFLLDVLAEHLPQQDKFRRAVESIVLPFLTDMQSPIEREQYLREIARRLGVSEEAVREAYLRTPRVGGPLQTQSNGAQKDPVLAADRVRQAFSLLIWQKSMQKPAIDVKKYASELEELVGKETLDIFVELPEAERESMRFAAQMLHGGSSSVPKEAEALLSILRREQLTARLAAAATALKSAESAGNESEMERLMGELKLLTGLIAKFHSQV